jgi:hypothetical protein
MAPRITRGAQVSPPEVLRVVLLLQLLAVYAQVQLQATAAGLFVFPQASRGLLV